MEHALGISYYALVTYADDLTVFCPTPEKAVETQEGLADVLCQAPYAWRFHEDLLPYKLRAQTT